MIFWLYLIHGLVYNIQVPEDNTRRNVKTDLRYTVLLGNNQLIQALLEIGADPNEGFRRVTRSLVVRFFSFSSKTNIAMTYMAPV